MAKPEIKARCWELYVKQRKTLKEIIALEPDVSSSTVYVWAKQDRWDRQREDQSTSAYEINEAIREAIRVQTDQLRNCEPDQITRISDSLVKLLATIQKLDRSVDFVGTALRLFGELTNYLMLHDRALAEKLVDDHVQGFTDHMYNKYRGN